MAFSPLLAAQDARHQQAGLRPNPQLTLDADNVLGTGALGGSSGAELSLSLSQLIELGDLRERRVATASLARSGLEVDAHIARLDAVALTARRFVSLAAQQEQHQLTHQAVALAERTAAAVERRVTAAKSPLAERDRAAVALERARNDDAHAEHQLVVGRHALAACWGQSQPDFDAVAANLYALPELADYGELMTRLAGTPDLQRYLSQARLHEAEAELARASRRPGITVGAGVRHLRSTGDTALLLSVGAPLLVHDRSQGYIAESQALGAGALARAEAALLNAKLQLFTHYQELLDLRRQLAALGERSLPLMETALSSTEYAYERGRYSYLELIDAQRELMSLRAERIVAAERYHLSLIELERLSGTAASR